MRQNIKRIILVVTVSTVCILVSLAFQLERIEDPRIAFAEEDRLAKSVATIPLGITAAEVENYIGSKPDSVCTDEAILVSSTMIYSASNEQGLALGTPQQFEFRRWKRGNLNASIALSSDGKVAAKQTWRDE
ncbi:MAG: hypothetical protein AAGA30_19355 [Planctomycetota bacterium]